jgi:FAD/FMN-containing dehydrogenase
MDEPMKPLGWNLDRRTLLRLGTACGASALLGACAGPDESGPPEPPTGSAAVTQLRSQVHGQVLLPGEPGYAEATSGFNRTQSHSPDIVVAAADAQDVQTAVRHATGNGMPIAVRATGHQSSVPIAGGLLLSTRDMTGVRVDADRRSARVEAGALWGPVVDAVAPTGLAPLTGSSPGVGVVGYTVGGGMSPVLGRTHGYAADHVTALDIVTADGALRTVTADADPELFWAVRGGKSNFGIVTGLEFGLFPLPDLYAGSLMFPGAVAADVLPVWRDWTATAPDEVTSSAVLLPLPPAPGIPESLHGELVLILRVAFAGPATVGERLVAPLRAAGPVLADGVAPMPLTGFAAIHADPPGPVNAYERTALLRELPDEAIEQLVALASPAPGAPQIVAELRQLGGALGRPPAVPNAIGHRDAAFTLFVLGEAEPDQAQAVRDREAALLSALQPWSTGGTFVNFLSSDDAAPDRVRTAYEPDTYQELVRLKSQFDPDGFFRFTHVIRDDR